MREPVVFGTHDENTLKQLADVASRAERAALMADGHLGYVMPIGGVAAYENQVSVVGVGFDIACGNAAIRTNLYASDIDNLGEPAWASLADEIQNTISFGVGRTNKADDAPTDHFLFDSPAWDALPQDANAHNLKGKARSQLGTVGSGNHYVDVFSDEQGRIWVGVHFGSRGFGHTVASGFLALAQNKPFTSRVPEQETLFRLDTPLGEAYWALMTLAGEYAYAGREWVVRKVVSLLGGHEVELVHNHHNFAWKETHEGKEYVVVRKGATPAFPKQKGFIGGSMGDNAVIVEGTETRQSCFGSQEYEERIVPIKEKQEAALYSTVHGAGRVMSRTQAKGKHRGKPNEVQPRIRHDDWQEWLKRVGVILRGGDLDEAPQAYRRLPDVLAAQGDTITVLHTLTPLIVVMAGRNEFDPYKD
jgi:tRNA-splicing ligase RtcB